MTDWSQIAAEVGALLKEKGQTVAVAESSSGGLISAACWLSLERQPILRVVGRATQGRRSRL